MQVNGEIDVDEHVVVPVERRAHAISGVGRNEHSLQGRWILTGDERVAHPKPRHGRA
jgi:hypothetical protein